MKEKIIALWKDKDNQLSYGRWLYRQAKPYWRQILGKLLLSLLDTGIVLILAIITKRIIDSATNHKAHQTLIVCLIIYVALVLLSELMKAAVSIVTVMVNEKISFGIRKKIYEKILNTKWMKIQKYHTGDLMTRMTSDAGIISEGIVNIIPNIISLCLQLLLVFFTLFYYSKLLAVIALAICPVIALVGIAIGRKLKNLSAKVQETESAYRSYLQESIANIMVIKAFVHEKQSLKKLTELRKERYGWMFRQTKLNTASATIMSLAFQLGYIIAFTYGALLVSLKTITFGTMTVFLTLVNRVQAPIMELAQQIPKVVAVLASVGRVIEIYDLPEEARLASMETAKAGIEARHINFGYTKEEPLILDGNLHIAPGQKVAIVGQSGIGKTTLLRILMSFVDISGGSLSIYGEGAQRTAVNAQTRALMAYVPQGNSLFSGTIGENIRMGRQDATDEEIWRVIREAAAYEFVSRLPEGLDTRIGEKGFGLSEGQAQRIAIARALIRKVPFLILDEATSALDMQTELEIVESIRHLSPDQTCLIITHRKSILPCCDMEIRIEDKKIKIANEAAKRPEGHRTANGSLSG